MMNTVILCTPVLSLMVECFQERSSECMNNIFMKATTQQKHADMAQMTATVMIYCLSSFILICSSAIIINIIKLLLSCIKKYLLPQNCSALINRVVANGRHNVVPTAPSSSSSSSTSSSSSSSSSSSKWTHG